MIELSFGPDWFNIGAILIDFIGILVLILLGFTSLKHYKMCSSKSYLYLASSFFMIAISFVFKMLTNIAIFYSHLVSRDLGVVTSTMEVVRSYNIFSIFSFFFYVLFNLIGLYMLYSIYQPRQPRSNVFLITFFILMLTYFSRPAFYLFHLTSFLLTGFIAITFYNKYMKTKFKRTKLLSYGFGVIALSQAFFMFIAIHPVVFVISELVQLVGYSILLATLVLVVSYGKKKK